MIVVAVVLWATDLLAQQQGFGFFVSAEFVAFSMLVYVYYKKNREALNDAWISIGFLGLALLVILGGAAFLDIGMFSQKILPLSVSVSPASIKIGITELQQFNASVTGGVAPYSYQWYVNNASVAGTTSSTFTFNSSSTGSDQIYVNATDTVGTVVKSNVVSVTVVVPNVSVTLYEGEVSATQYGFGNTSTTVTSPGPTLNFKVGDVVNMTVYNISTLGLPHNWALTTTNNYANATVMFDAQIASGTNPLQPGTHGSVVFSVTQAGNFYYICQVPGHTDVGMWGRVIIVT